MGTSLQELAAAAAWLSVPFSALALSHKWKAIIDARAVQAAALQVDEVSSPQAAERAAPQRRTAASSASAAYSHPDLCLLAGSSVWRC